MDKLQGTSFTSTLIHKGLSHLEEKKIFKVVSTESTFYSHFLKTVFLSTISRSSNCLIGHVQMKSNHSGVQQL